MRMASAGWAAALLVWAASGTWAQSGWKPTASFDYLGAGNLGRHNRDDANRRCKALLALGAATCSAQTSAPGAIGGRVGLSYDSSDFSLGPSVGAYYGGPTAGTRAVTITPAGKTDTAVRNTTFRFLVEDAKKFQLDEDKMILLGAGAGLAVVHESEWCSNSGALTGACNPSRPRNRGFATWEVGPSIVLGPVELALRWVGFARRTVYPWNTFSISLGLRL